MSNQKPSFVQDNQGTSNTDAGQEQGPVGFAPSQEQTFAYVYDLLTPEEGHVLEQRVQESASYREALEASRRERAFYDLWADVPPPKGLAENTLARIQQYRQESSSLSSDSSEPTS